MSAAIQVYAVPIKPDKSLYFVAFSLQSTVWPVGWLACWTCDLKVQFPAVLLLSNNFSLSCSQTCASATKQYIVMPYSWEGKVWCCTGHVSQIFFGLSTYRVMAQGREMSTPPTLLNGVLHTFMIINLIIASRTLTLSHWCNVSHSLFKVLFFTS